VHLATCCRWTQNGSYGFVTSDVRLDGLGEDRDAYCHKSKLPKGVKYSNQASASNSS
jgi:hypothetical protein